MIFRFIATLGLFSIFCVTPVMSAEFVNVSVSAQVDSSTSPSVASGEQVTINSVFLLGLDPSIGLTRAQTFGLRRTPRGATFDFSGGLSQSFDGEVTLDFLDFSIENSSRGFFLGASSGDFFVSWEGSPGEAPSTIPIDTTIELPETSGGFFPVENEFRIVLEDGEVRGVEPFFVTLSLTSVPEPSSSVLLLFSTVFMVQLRRRNPVNNPCGSGAFAGA